MTFCTCLCCAVSLFWFNITSTLCVSPCVLYRVDRGAVGSGGVRSARHRDATKKWDMTSSITNWRRSTCNVTHATTRTSWLTISSNTCGENTIGDYRRAMRWGTLSGTDSRSFAWATVSCVAFDIVQTYGFVRITYSLLNCFSTFSVSPMTALPAVSTSQPTPCVLTTSTTAVATQGLSEAGAVARAPV